jgi:EmrB/QacA subfamily drug resistance transporter
MTHTDPKSSPRAQTGGGAIAPAPARIVSPGLLLALVCLGQFMVVLDVSIVNVALPSIQAELRFSASGLQWVVNAYTLTFAGFLLLGGRAADLFGRRRMFILGLSLFTLASLAGGLAQNQAMLVGARALQGLGGAVLAPATLTILTTSFAEGGARARALGVWSAVAAGGGAAGALLGGILTDLISWRWILFVNVPIGIIAVVAARAILAETRGTVRHRSLDLPGALAVTGGLVALVYAIVRTGTYRWTAWQTLVPLGLAIVLLGAFLLIEGRLARFPLMPLRIFRSRSVSGANLVIMLLFSAMFASWYFETLFMQEIRGFSPLQAGLGFLPQTIMIAVGAQVTSRLVTRFGPRMLLGIGATVSAAGLAWLTAITPGSGFLGGLLGPTILTGLGFGLSVTPVTIAGTSGVPRRDAGLASGLLNSNRTVGASVGLAVLATVAADRSAALLAGSGPAVPQLAALSGGYARTFGVAAVICLAAGIVAWTVLPPARRSRDTVPGAAPRTGRAGTDTDHAEPPAAESA